MTGLMMEYLEHEIGGLAAMKQINEEKAALLYAIWTDRIFTRTRSRSLSAA